MDAQHFIALVNKCRGAHAVDVTERKMSCLVGAM